MAEMVDALDLGSRFWGFESLFLYRHLSIPTGRENGLKLRTVPVRIRGEVPINKDQWCTRCAHLSEKQEVTVQFGSDPLIMGDD